MESKITGPVVSSASQSDSSDNQASRPSNAAGVGGVLAPEGCTAREDDKERSFQAQAPCCHEFQWSSLWRRAEVNPINGKSFTFPLFRVWDPYSTAFWLATLGFLVAFLSWFALSPLMPEAVRADLGLTQDQVIDSNLASLGGTAIVRLVAGPACDRFGPRKVLATLLVLGAIPCGLAALVTNVRGLETARFFISTLGGAFVPTQAYTTTFFDKSIVGTANAFSGGWGNLGGGVTVAAMIGLYDRYTKAGYASHLSWRLCLLSVPVPCLSLAAVTILVLGRDHPAGKWSARHQFGSTAVAWTDAQGERAPSVDIAQSEPLTCATLLKILADLRVWMCASCYLLTFGLETALDAALPGLMNTLFASKTFTVVDAAYAASTYGLLNLFARPLGGIVSDLLYARFGLRAKVYWLLATTLSQGVAVLGLGIYINHGHTSIGGVLALVVLIAVTGFAANGACYSVYGHLRPKNIGAVAGIVGAGGNVGGLLYTLIFKYQPGKRLSPSPAYPHGHNSLGTKFWIAGVANVVGVLPFFLVRLRDAV